MFLTSSKANPPRTQIKPVDAIQWVGTWESVGVIKGFTNGAISERPDLDFKRCYLHIQTPAGERRVSPKDWILKTKSGALFILKPETFNLIFEPAPGEKFQLKKYL